MTEYIFIVFIVFNFVYEHILLLLVLKHRVQKLILYIYLNLEYNNYKISSFLCFLFIKYQFKNNTQQPSLFIFCSDQRAGLNGVSALK